MERTQDIKFNPILFVDMLIEAQRSEEIYTKSHSSLVLDGMLFYIGFRKIFPVFVNHFKVICIYTHIYVHQCVLLTLSNKNDCYLLQCCILGTIQTRKRKLMEKQEKSEESLEVS